MIGKSTIIWLGLAGAAGAVLYQTSYRVQAMQAELADINHKIVKEQDGIHVAQAEWSYLNDPSRLERLAKQYLPLQATAADQIVTIDDIPMRPAAPAADPNAPAPVPGQPALPGRKPALVAANAPALAPTAMAAPAALPAAPARIQVAAARPAPAPIAAVRQAPVRVARAAPAPPAHAALPQPARIAAAPTHDAQIPASLFMAAMGTQTTEVRR